MIFFLHFLDECKPKWYCCQFFLFIYHNHGFRKILNMGIMMDITLTLKAMTKVFVLHSFSLSGFVDFDRGINFGFCLIEVL